MVRSSWSRAVRRESSRRSERQGKRGMVTQGQADCCKDFGFFSEMGSCCRVSSETEAGLGLGFKRIFLAVVLSKLGAQGEGGMGELRSKITS